jgi:hypothetical protein
MMGNNKSMNYGSSMNTESTNDTGFTELTPEKVDNPGSGHYFMKIISSSI